MSDDKSLIGLSQILGSAYSLSFYLSYFKLVWKTTERDTIIVTQLIFESKEMWFNLHSKAELFPTSQTFSLSFGLIGNSLPSETAYCSIVFNIKKSSHFVRGSLFFFLMNYIWIIWGVGGTSLNADIHSMASFLMWRFII